MYDEIISLIKKYEHIGNFTYTFIKDEQIIFVENELECKIPDQYKWFLKTFGHGGLDGIETLGVGKNGKLIFFDTTLTYRKYGLPKNFLVIEDCDEWLYCIDTIDEKIVEWSRLGEESEKVYSCFLDYLEDRILDTVENL